MMSLIGCTTSLTANRLDLAGSQPQPGWDYSLPFAQYEISIVRTLNSCTTQSDVDVKATAVTTFVPDPANTFTIDYRSLASSTKISDLQIDKHANGMLKKIGAAAEDRTGPIVVNTATAIAKIAAAAAGVPRPLAPPGLVGVCNSATSLAVTDKPRLRGRVEVATKLLNEATTRLEALTAVAVPFGGRADSTTQRELLRAARDVATYKSQLAQETVSYAKVVDQLTITTQLRWPPNGDERTSQLQKLTEEELTQWFTSPDLSSVKPVVFELQASSGLGVPAPAQPGTGTAKAHPEPLRYRVPVKGKLLMHQKSGAEDDVTVKTKLVTEGPVPQLGRIYLLPLQNKAFQNNVLNATFAEDGNLLAAGYIEKSSSAEAASETLAKVAGLLPQAIQDVRLGGAQSEAAEIEAKTKVLEAQAKLQAARDALSPSPTEDAEKKRALLAADSALLDAERAKIVAQYLLDQARLDPTKVIDQGKDK